MTAISILGDRFECGDTIMQGSDDVMIGNIPVARKGDKTTGHGCFNPNMVDAPCSSNVFVNNKAVATKGYTMDAKHYCKSSVHQTKVATGQSSVFAN